MQILRVKASLKNFKYFFECTCFSLKLIPHINTKKYASVLLQVNPTTIVITNLWGQGGCAKSCKGGGGGGVKIFQLPLLYFTPVVTNIGESLSRATPAWTGSSTDLRRAYARRGTSQPAE